jgi:glycosyltransferase involved in cell wall biosynthesis
LLAQYLGIRGSIDVLPYLTPELLAAASRRSSVLLQTSDSDGFGLPVIEALACGAPVIASDIAPLREVGGAAVTFCPVADIGAWTAAVLQQLTTPPSRAALLAQAGRFNWSSYAASMTGIYRKVLARGPEEK